MFTGIVAELGEVVGVVPRGDAARLTIRGSTEGVALGESIAVNGVCLTVTEILDGTFTADVMGETLDRSGLGALIPGAPVNLERSVRLADRLGGHLVQGHVDATGAIISRTPAEHWDQVRISLPGQLSRYVVEKGSIAVDGISLTVSALSAPDATESWFEVCLIPETLKRTTLGTASPGDTVNLEVDVIAKYVERLLSGHSVSKHSVSKHSVSEHSVSEHSVSEHSVSEHSVSEHSVSEHSVSEHSGEGSK